MNRPLIPIYTADINSHDPVLTVVVDVERAVSAIARAGRMKISATAAGHKAFGSLVDDFAGRVHCVASSLRRLFYKDQREWRHYIWFTKRV